MKLLEADTKKLEYLLNLSYGTLYIPYSQRPYEWKYEQVLRLFNDFYSIYTNDDTSSTHILNFITIKLDEDDENKKYIYDGQQRTVTSLLILTALINELAKIDDSAKDSAKELRKLYLYTSYWKDASAINYKIVFESTIANKMLHDNIFEEKEREEDHVLGDYDKALFNNYNSIKALIHERFGNVPDKKMLMEFIDTILERVLVIIIETSYENIAEEMFETLNSTGLQIEDFYILKNALIRTLGEETVKPVWSTIEFNTDRLSKNKFLHAYINARAGKSSSTDLYNQIASLTALEEPETAEALLYELRKASDIFMKIDNPSQKTDGTQKQNNKYLQSINNLVLLSANQYKPLVMAMGLKEYSIEDINLVLEKIIALQLRNIFMAKYKGNTLEQFYPSLARRIYCNEIVSVNDILAEISSMMISDSQLYDSFNNRLIETRNDESVIRYVLKEIYNSQHNEIIINANSRDVNLEHILPVTPAEGSRWMKEFPDTEQRYVLTHKIGNLTVLLNKINSKIKNNDFSIKKESYVQSAIPENQQLAQKSEWRKSDIDQRTIDLYNIFKVIWAK